jgi:ABC-type bacteriocin/lantibiotic exporter with double-glycine peptidase domain
MGVSIALSSIASPYLIGKTINTYTAYGEVEKLTIILACSSILLNPCLRFFSGIYVQKVSARTREMVKQHLIKKLVTDAVPINHTYGEVIDRIDGDVEETIYLYHSLYLDIAQNSSMIFLSMYMIFKYHPSMTLAPLAAIGYSLLIHLIFRKAPLKSFSAYVDKNTEFISAIGESLHIKPRPSFELHRAACSQLKTLSLFARGRMSILELLSSISYLIGIILLFKIGSESIISGELSIGDFVAIAVYLERILAPALALIGIYYSTSEAFYRRARVKKTLFGDSNV